MSKSTQEKQIAKANGKPPVFLDPPDYPTHLSLIQFDDYSNPQAERRSDELKYLANVFDAIKDLKDVLHDHPGWDYIWQVLIEPIDKAAKIASNVAVDEAHDPKSRNVTNKVNKVHDLCTVVHHKTLNDPCNGYGIITSLVPRAHARGDRQTAGLRLPRQGTMELMHLRRFPTHLGSH